MLARKPWTGRSGGDGSGCGELTPAFVFSSLVTQNAHMSLLLRSRLILVLGLSLSCFQCQTGSNGDLPAKPPSPPENVAVPIHGYQIVNISPHDSNAFTQGLILVDGKLLES